MLPPGSPEVIHSRLTNIAQDLADIMATDRDVRRVLPFPARLLDLADQIDIPPERPSISPPVLWLIIAAVAALMIAGMQECALGEKWLGIGELVAAVALTVWLAQVGE